MRLLAVVLATLVGLVLVFTGRPAHAAEEPTLSKDDEACLKCHDKDGLQDKKLGDGHSLSLRVSTKAFLASMHNTTSCEDCHDSLDAKTHGKVETPLKSRRELSLSMQESCRTCHKKKYKQYDDSIHAVLIKDGSDKAPLCSDCHDSHTQRSVKIVAPIAETPCVRCHDEIYKAYAKDVHGVERAAKGKAAPLCSDCHQAHDVKAASLGDGPKEACLSCHKDAVKSHQDWLPNAELHFTAISCPACHAPTAQRRVNLRLYDGVAQRQLAEKSGVPQFVRRARDADTANQGLDERALWSLLQQFSQDKGHANTTLRGRLEVRSGVEAHQLTDKSQAVKDCKVCHQQGAEPFQSVILTIAGADGRPLRHGVQKDVLNSLTAMESVRGFYAIGSTRIKLLDVLLVLVVTGSIAGVLMHLALRRSFKSLREKRETEKLAASAASGQSQNPTPDRRPNDDRAN